MNSGAFRRICIKIKFSSQRRDVGRAVYPDNIDAAPRIQEMTLPPDIYTNALMNTNTLQSGGTLLPFLSSLLKLPINETWRWAIYWSAKVQSKRRNKGKGMSCQSFTSIISSSNLYTFCSLVFNVTHRGLLISQIRDNCCRVYRQAINGTLLCKWRSRMVEKQSLFGHHYR